VHVLLPCAFVPQESFSGCLEFRLELDLRLSVFWLEKEIIVRALGPTLIVSSLQSHPEPPMPSAFPVLSEKVVASLIADTISWELTKTVYQPAFKFLFVGLNIAASI
jgi:hypothetical protein